MQLLDQLANWSRRDARKYIVARVPDAHVANTVGEPAPLRAGRHYFRVWLCEMFLRRDREWFKSWHPAVHSLVRVQFGGTTIEVPYIAGPLRLQGVDAAHLDRVIQLNHPLTSLLPFNGGSVELAVGMLAMQGDDSIARFLNVMGNFAGLFASQELTMVLNLAAPLASGIQELIGITDGQLHLGVHQTYTSAGGGGGNELRPGYLLVALADDGELDTRELWVSGDRLQRGSSLADSLPITGHTYMLLRIEARQERDDWDSLQSMQLPFQAAIAALGDREYEQAETQFRHAVSVALLSPDLARADRRRVALALKEEFDAAKELGLGAMRASPSGLGQIMQRAGSVDQAASLGDISFEELFAT
jgi:hypothetical protein